MVAGLQVLTSLNMTGMAKKGVENRKKTEGVRRS